MSRALPKRRRRKKTSYDVFLDFVTYDHQSNVVSVDNVFELECFEYWVETRSKTPKNPEESFRRALTAHVRGTDLRKPFPPEVERLLLLKLREKTPWKHFDKIGAYGFRGKGYWEIFSNAGADFKEKKAEIYLDEVAGDKRLGCIESSRLSIWNENQGIKPESCNDLLEQKSFEDERKSIYTELTESEESARSIESEIDSDVISSAAQCFMEEVTCKNKASDIADLLIPPLDMDCLPSKCLGSNLMSQDDKRKRDGEFQRAYDYIKTTMNRSTFSKISDRLAALHKDLYSDEELDLFMRSYGQHTNLAAWFSPSTRFHLDRFYSQQASLDPRLSKEFMFVCPEERYFDTNKPIGSQIVSPVCRTILDTDRAIRQMYRGDCRGYHSFDFWPSTLEAMMRFSYIAPLWVSSSEFWTRHRIYRLDGSLGIFLRHYKQVVNRNGVPIYVIRQQEVTENFSHLLNLPNLLS